jgi:hypothetical protein
MRRVEILLLFMLVFCGWLGGQTPSITANCAPSAIFVNSLSTSQFDPVNPANQPILTTMMLSNATRIPFHYQLTLSIRWNDIPIITNIRYESKEELLNTVTLTNRDFINSGDGDYLNPPEGDISISTIIEQSNILRDALQSGYFPDGTLHFDFVVEPFEAIGITPVPNYISFTITVKNINSIFLTYPGKPLGQTPPEINIRPVTFLWNSMSTVYDQSFRKYRLIIREFVPANPPNANSVETAGKKVYDALVSDNVFTEFLPFQDKHYYAWQVSTGLYTESDALPINSKNNQQANQIMSDWYVFRYLADADAMGSFSQLRAILNQLNDETIQGTFSQGFDVTGAVFYEGQVYTGKEAVDLAKTLLGKDIEVEIRDN